MEKSTTLQIRTNESNKEDFTRIMEELEVKTQGEALTKLINIFNGEKAKGKLSNRSKEIEAVRSHLDSIANLYLNSLDINQVAEEEIRKHYENELNSKDISIRDLQKERAELKEKLEKAKDVEKENKEISKEKEKLEKNIEQNTKDLLDIKEQNNTLNAIINEYKSFKDINAGLEKENRAAKELVSIKENKIIDLENKLNVCNNKTEEIKELYNNNLIATKEEYKSTINNLKEESIFNIKALKLENKENIKELKEEIKELKLENKKDFEEKNKENNELRIENNNLKQQLEKLKKELKEFSDKKNDENPFLKE